MAKRVEPLNVGIDVSKSELWAAPSTDAKVETIANTRKAVCRWLRTLPRGSSLALEATNTYHMLLAEEAWRRGFVVYLLDGFRLNRYRDSIGGRAKTDRTDAQLLRRYLTNEGNDLRPWSPPPKAYRDIQTLLHRRATLVESRKSLQQSLQIEGIKGIQTAFNALLKQIKRLELVFEKRLREAVRNAGWLADVQRCQQIEGIGFLTATALTQCFNRGDFRSSDAYIAFMGMDVRVRDSGRQQGRRKLTKKGDAEFRRLLHNAAMSAVRSATWKPLYQRYLDRGLARTQVLVIIARKLARVAFALLKNQTTYQPKTA